MIDQALPEALRDEWKAAMEKCLDNEGTGLKIPFLNWFK
jgi:hypothetical protein